MTKGKFAFILFCLCVISFALGKYGKECFYNGHGTIGSIRYDLLPISEEFNKIDAIIRVGGIKAEYIEDRIEVTTTKNKYVYTYLKENGQKYIINSFDSDDKEGQLVASSMLDAVYRYNGGFGTMYINYNFFNFMSTKAEECANLSLKDKYEIKINVNKKLIDCLQAL